MPIKLNPCKKCGCKAKRVHWWEFEFFGQGCAINVMMYACVCPKCGKQGDETKRDNRADADAAWNAANPQEQQEVPHA